MTCSDASGTQSANGGRSLHLGQTCDVDDRAPRAAPRRSARSQVSCRADDGWVVRMPPSSAGIAVFAAVTLLGGPTVSAAPASTPASQPCTTVAARPSPWSVSPSWGSSWNPADWASRVAAAGVTNVRGFRDDSPTRSAIAAAGMTTTGILQWSPPGGAARFPSSDLGGWARYVRDTVTRHPEVREWEVWNEPPNFTADGDPAHYAQIVRTAYDTAKSVDRCVRIGLAAKATFIAWLGEAIEAGAARHFDYVTLHPYERAGKLWDGWEEPFLATVPQVRAMLAGTSPTQVDVPVHFTEVGAPAGIRAGQAPDLHANPADQAVLLAKVMTLSLAQGVQRVSWYDPFDGDFSAGEAPYGLIALDGHARPALTAYTNVISALGSRPTFLGLVKTNPTTYVLAFGSKRKMVLVAWASGGRATITLAAPGTVRQVTDARSARRTRISLTSTPELISLASAQDRLRWLAMASAARAPRASSRVVASWSAASGAAGLYVAGGTPTAASARRSGYRPSSSGLQFAVDGQFPAWRSGPIQVTVVARALNGSPGFNLKYDGASALSSLDWAGQRSSGSWQSIRGGDWQTLSWILKDARFSGMYGFNLRLDSDSATYAGYAIASASVRALPAATRAPTKARGPRTHPAPPGTDGR